MAAHSRFLEAGADVIATATYQATVAGFRKRGLARDEAEDVLRGAVGLAVSARDAFWACPEVRERRAKPLVAASVGPYGAYLADGSEYKGDYGLSTAELYDFHARRWEALAGSEADLLACETTPSCEEARAYCRLAADAGCPAWISFQCSGPAALADGTSFEEAVALCHSEPRIVAVGVNCTDPRYVTPLIRAVRRMTSKPVLVYPNSGEVWDADAKRWRGASCPDWVRRAAAWFGDGAVGVGGCCRVGPAEIAAVRGSLSRLAAR